MEKIIRVVADNIIQLTFCDERWYIKTIKLFDDDGNPQGEEYKTVPSITWIASYYPKGVAFYKWLANHSWDETQAIKESAGNKGSKVHLAIADLIAGNEVNMASKYPNRAGVDEELTADEYYYVMTFVDWFKEVKPRVYANEKIVFGEKFAGTLDLYCMIRRLVKKATNKEDAVYADELWIIDFKTGASIWPEHHVQLAGYKALLMEQLEEKSKCPEYKDDLELCPPIPEIKLGILQIGYKKNKRGFKFTEIPDNLEILRATHRIWVNETAGISPKQIDYPIKLTLKEEEDVPDNGVSPEKQKD